MGWEKNVKDIKKRCKDNNNSTGSVTKRTRKKNPASDTANFHDSTFTWR